MRLRFEKKKVSQLIVAFHVFHGNIMQYWGGGRDDKLLWKRSRKIRYSSVHCRPVFEDKPSALDIFQLKIARQRARR